MTDSPNPYESPKSPSVVTSPPVATLRIESAWARIKRATVKSIAFGLLGFAIVRLSVFASLAIAFYAMEDSSAIKMFFDVRREILLPSAAVGVLFMIAAFRNYAVQQPIGFLRSLILVGVCLILGVAIASSLNMTLSLDDKFNVSTPLDWFTLVAGLTPVSVYFAVVLRKELAAQERNLLDTRRGRVE